MPWVIDAKHSYVGFAIRHMGISMVRGVFHSYRGTIQLDEQDLTRSAFSGEIDVASLDTHEEKRDEHLRSAEFFDVAKYPTISYCSRLIEAVPGNLFRVTGALRIKDVTRDVVVEGTYLGASVADPWGVKRTGFSASGHLDRRDFGLVWNVVLDRGGLLVAERVDLQLDIELLWEPETPAAGAGTTP